MSFDMRVPWRIFSRPTELAESGFAGLKNRGSHILAGVDMKVSEKLAHRASAGYVLLENLMASCLKSNSSIIK